MNKKINKISAKEFNERYGTNFKVKKGNKFNAKKIKLDKKIFDSTSEGNYYSELKLQERGGLIQGFDIQVKESFYMNEVWICDYYVDFLVYHNDGSREFIEHKGMATDAWRLKWKMLQAKYKDDKNVKCTINWYKSKFKYKK